MAAVYSPESLGIKPPAGGFQQGGWYQARQYWGGTLSDPGTIHPSSNQQGAGQKVSAEVNAQSAQQQGVSPEQFESYIESQRKNQPAGSYSGSSLGSSTINAGAGLGIKAPETINLPDIYQKLLDASGIKSLQEKLTADAKGYSDVVAGIKDNPYLSEGTMTGRIAKIDEKFNRDARITQDEIATKKADIETKLNLELKQFDINSQQARQAMDQFNTLLAAGALDNASGDDIANLTRATGLSSSMIYSAINAQKQKNIQTSTISYDDGTNQGFAIINSQTGEIISKQTIASSKPKASTEGEKSQSLTSKAISLLDTYKNSYGHVDPNTWQQILSAFIADGGTRDLFIKNFGQYTDPNRGDFDSAYGFGLDKR